jgi:hypothetical protein
MITYNTLTLLFPYSHPMTYDHDLKNVFLRAANLNTSVIWLVETDKDLPTIKSKLSPNGNAPNRFKKPNAFSVLATSINTMFTATHIWPLPPKIFVVKTHNFNILHANKLLSTPSNKMWLLLFGFDELNRTGPDADLIIRTHASKFALDVVLL